MFVKNGILLTKDETSELFLIIQQNANNHVKKGSSTLHEGSAEVNDILCICDEDVILQLKDLSSVEF